LNGAAEQRLADAMRLDVVEIQLGDHAGILCRVIEISASILN